MLKANKQKSDHVPYRIAFGPVTYHTTDENIKARIQIALSQKCGVDLSNVQIKVFEGDVSISGVVSSNQLTYISEEIVHCGVHEIENLLRVI